MPGGPVSSAVQSKYDRKLDYNRNPKFQIALVLLNPHLTRTSTHSHTYVFMYVYDMYECMYMCVCPFCG